MAAKERRRRWEEAEGKRNARREWKKLGGFAHSQCYGEKESRSQVQEGEGEGGNKTGEKKKQGKKAHARARGEGGKRAAGRRDVVR